MKTLLIAAALLLISLNFGAHALRSPAHRTASHATVQAAVADKDDGGKKKGDNNGDDDDDDDEDDEEDRA